MVKISDIDQNTFDLSVKNPNAPIEPPLRHTQEILAEMKILDTESAEIITLDYNPRKFISIFKCLN
jgi:type I restriction enzyme M protein